MGSGNVLLRAHGQWGPQAHRRLGAAPHISARGRPTLPAPPPAGHLQPGLTPRTAFMKPTAPKESLTGPGHHWQDRQQALGTGRPGAS